MAKNCTNGSTPEKAAEVVNVVKADVNFTVLKGDTFDASLSFFDASDRPLNISTATVLMHIRSDDDTLLATLESGSGFTVSANVLTFSYDTILDAGLYFYDLQCTFANGVKKTLIGGRYKVLKDITY